MSVDVWCKGDEQMQDVIVDEDAVRWVKFKNMKNMIHNLH